MIFEHGCFFLMDTSRFTGLPFLFPGWTFKGSMLVNGVHNNLREKVERLIKVVSIQDRLSWERIDKVGVKVFTESFCPKG